MRGGSAILAHAVVAVCAASCVTFPTETCGDLVCGPDSRCSPQHGRCIADDAFDACNGRAQGDDCTVGGFDGSCDQGACVSSECGDGAITGAEECEPGDLAGFSCTALGFYEPEGLTCDPVTCTYDDMSCVGQCGDEIINGPELCDTAPPTTLNCLKFDFQFGAMRCSDICGLDPSDCRTIGWNRPTLPDLVNDVWLADASLAYAVSSGQVLVRRDGIWDVEVIPGTSPPFRSVWGTAADDVYVLTRGVLHHFDGTEWTSEIVGASWLTVRGGGGELYATTLDNNLMRRIGANWIQVALEKDNNTAITALWVGKDGYAFIGLDNGIIMNNGSGEWLASQVDDNPVTSITGKTNQFFTSASTNNGLFKFDGQVWNPVPLHPGISNITSLYATSTQRLFLGTSDPNSSSASVWSYDGDRWLQLETGVGDLVTGFSSENIVAVGPTVCPGSVCNRPVADFSRLDVVGQNNLTFVPHEAAVLARDHVVVVGDEGNAVEYDGARWQPLDLGPMTAQAAGSIVAASASGPDFAVLASQTQLAQFDGTDWTVFDPGLPQQISDVWVESPTRFYVVGSGGMLARFDDQQNFELVDTGFPIFGTLASIGGNAAGVLVAVELGGETYVFDGSSWTEHQVGNFGIVDIHVTEDGAVYVASGRFGALDYYDGIDWTTLETGADAFIHSVGGRAPDDVFIGGQRLAGETGLFHWNGEQWSPIDLGDDNETNHIAVSSDHVVFTGTQMNGPGSFGTIRILTYVRP